MDQTIGREIRRNRYNLYYSAFAVIVFGIWDSVRASLTIFRDKEFVEEVVLSFGDLGFNSLIIKVSLFFFVAMLALFSVSVRLYIGVCGIKEAKDGKKRWAYIAVAIIYLILLLNNYIYFFIKLKDNIKDLDILDSFITVIIELTSIYAFLHIVYSGIRLKKLYQYDKS